MENKILPKGCTLLKDGVIAFDLSTLEEGEALEQKINEIELWRRLNLKIF